MSARLLSGTLVCLVALVLGLDALEAAAPAQASTPTARASSTYTQRVVVKWKGKTSRKGAKTAKSAVIPGIGSLQATCRPNNTILKLTASDRSAETQMWMAKYETKHGDPVVSVKTVRLYRYANADDDGTGGTGASAHEGLNQKSPIEDHESGYLHGLVSQRPGRNRSAAAVTAPPATSFELTWFWTGFRHKRAQQSCRMVLTTRTDLSHRLGVDWHGDQDPAATTQSTPVPGIGTLQLTCQHGPAGDQSITLLPTSPSAWVYGEQITGEGDVEDHVDPVDLVADPLTGAVGPIELPSNGMLRLFYTVAGRSYDVLVSSYDVVNNAARSDLNLCEVAAAPF